MLTKIISGAQTGADRAGLIAAKQVGLDTGGWMPKGYLAQDEGPTGNRYHPEFAEMYGIKEHSSPKYPPRTAMNVKQSDGTIRFATNWASSGERLTLRMIKQYSKPYIDVDPNSDDVPPDLVARWILDNNIKVLNVAGNSERTSPGIARFTVDFLLSVFELLRDSNGKKES